MKANTTAGQLFKAARTKKGLTQYDVAKKSDIHPNTYAKIERGVQKASFSTIKELAKVLDLNINDIPV
jgi:transcriptional regulator with XRE-family HTH domain